MKLNLKRTVWLPACILMLVNLAAACQDLNRHAKDPVDGDEILYGYCNPAGLAEEPFGDWFRPRYDEYNVDQIKLDELNTELFYSSTITVVMGTWCSDSRREVPRFLKILDGLGYDTNALNMICVDRNKYAEVPELEKLSVQLVPTFIFSNDEIELGRIVESPEESLEADMVKIFQ